MTLRDVVALTQAIAFGVVISWMTFRHYDVFHLRAPDVATFVQAIWNTLHGRFLYSTVIDASVLSFHFTPFFAFLAPLLLIWEDPRILFLAQTVAVTATGLILYVTVRKEQPHFAPWLLAAFYLNPAVHDVALHELRRVIFAMPFIALALLGIDRRRYRLATGALVFALLTKETIGLIVFACGLFLLLFRREWTWGSAWVGLGLVWTLGVTFCVIPSFHPDSAGFACSSAYPQINSFGGWQDPETLDSYELETEIDSFEGTTIIRNILSQPQAVLARIFDPAGRIAMWRLLLPLGLLLPFIGLEWLLIAAPTLFLLLVSSDERLHSLVDWNTASVLPALMMSVALGVKRLESRLPRKGLALGLLTLTVCGYYFYSLLPGAINFYADRYRPIAHHDVARRVLAEIPAEASVAAQDAFVNHLALRETIFLYPFYDETEPVDFIVLDNQLRQYPFTIEGIKAEIDKLVADPAQVVWLEGDGMYVLASAEAPLPAIAVDLTAEEAINLEQAEVAVADQHGIYRPLDIAAEDTSVMAGDQLRITLYWRALAKPVGDRTVSVRLSAADGWLWAQHDGWPSNGARPTSWWETGWYFRDVYYLTIDPGANGDGQLEVLLYDSTTRETVPFGDRPMAPLAILNVLPPQ